MDNRKIIANQAAGDVQRKKEKRKYSRPKLLDLTVGSGTNGKFPAASERVGITPFGNTGNLGPS